MHDDDEDIPPKKQYPLSASKMSKTPSWIMLGFVLGAVFMLAFQRRAPKPAPAPPPAAAEPAQPAEPRTPPPLTLIETVFEKWGEHAVWSDGTTEVAMWSPATEKYSDFYEVRKIDGALYFRTIPQLTRRIISRGKPMPESLLQFTETEEQYREWYEHGRSERPFERLWQKPPPPAASTQVKPDAPVAPQTSPVVPTFEKPALPKAPLPGSGK